jgi:hypothetical protein
MYIELISLFSVFVLVCGFYIYILNWLRIWMNSIGNGYWSEMHFDTVLRICFWNEHHSRIIDQERHSIFFIFHFFDKFSVEMFIFFSFISRKKKQMWIWVSRYHFYYLRIRNVNQKERKRKKPTEQNLKMKCQYAYIQYRVACFLSYFDG